MKSFCPANQLRLVLVVHPIIYNILYIPNGAGYLPSTIFSPFCHPFFQGGNMLAVRFREAKNLRSSNQPCQWKDWQMGLSSQEALSLRFSICVCGKALDKAVKDKGDNLQSCQVMFLRWELWRKPNKNPWVFFGVTKTFLAFRKNMGLLHGIPKPPWNPESK